MFHEGNLQSGIARAIQEQKLVGVFVRDDGAESAAWEGEWLQGGWVSSLLEQRAVVLRLEAGSTEAGYLSAFCTIERVPTFVVIQSGQLQEQLTSGISKEEFVNRLRKALGAPPIPGAAQFAPQALPEQTPPPAASTPTSVPISTPISEKAKGKQKATESDRTPQTSSTQDAQRAARAALQKKKREEKEELERIKARIEADKAARRAEAELRKAEREQQAQQSENPVQAPRASTRGSQAKEVHLNVRLFDGRTIRSKFPRTAKLQNDVRPWIDQEFAARAEQPNERHPPYYFKQILAPLPNKELSMSEEDQTLGDIDLAPSATLVLVPVKGYADAYSGSGGGVVGSATGAVTGLVGGVFGLASSALGYVGSTVQSVLGGSSAPAETQDQSGGRPLGDSRSQDDSRSQGDGSAIRVRTLADQRAREPRSQQLYNGNQLNFEDRDEGTNR